MVTEKQFQHFFQPYLSVPVTGPKPKVPLFRIFNYILYQLRTGCQWDALPILVNPVTNKKEISHTAVWKWFNRWSGDGSFEQSLTESVRLLNEKNKLRIKRINLDGTNSVAKKGAKTLGIPATNTRRDKRQSA
jgi:transposase